MFKQALYSLVLALFIGAIIFMLPAHASADEMPIVSAKLLADQTVTSGVEKNVLFTDILINDGSFASSTFQPSVAGYYNIEYTLRCAGTGAANDGCFGRIYKNNTLLFGNSGPAFAFLGTDISAVSFSGITYFNGTTDKVDFRVFNLGGDKVNSAANTHVHIFKVNNTETITVNNPVNDVFLIFVMFASGLMGIIWLITKRQ